MIWLCNPNNPTGGYNQTAALRDFMTQVPKDVLVLIDEAYIDFVRSAQPASALPLLKEFDNVAVLRTFSKIYGLAGYRVGYLIVDDQRAALYADGALAIQLEYAVAGRGPGSIC